MTQAPPENVSRSTGSASGELGHLDVDQIVAGYGGAAVLRGVSFAAHPGEVVAVLGRNGAGKTTLLRTISGLLTPRDGTISLDGVNLCGRPVHEIVRLGVGQVPEGRRVMPSMTVLDNLRLGAYLLRRRGQLAERLDEVLEVLPMLAGWRDRLAGTLSGGEQQLLAIGRALMGAPRVLLLDEPLTGLSPTARQLVLGVIRQIGGAERTVVIVEQNLGETLPIADRALLINEGRVSMEGSAHELLNDASVQEKYLGLTLH